MDRERLFKVIGEKYIAKNELYGYLPLGVNADEIWGTVLEQRRAKAIALPLTNAAGQPYWYTLTDKMIIASENIVNELFEHNVDKPLSSVMSIREIYFTGYLEGAQISVQDAMSFLQSGEEPHDVEELMILNNRQAGSFAAENIYRPLNEDYIKALAQILTNGLDNGGGELRTVDSVEIYSMQGENYVLPSAARLSGCVKEISSFLADLSVHPLIKSAVAQAWTMVVRPFPEGNERLGRLLSEIILVRSGYTFFGEDSVSAVIAKSGFKYFDSIAKSIRSDNGGDLTYFLEYYLSVLSSFVDDIRYKRNKKNAEEREAEKELAKQTLAREKKEAETQTFAIANNEQEEIAVAKSKIEERLRVLISESKSQHFINTAELLIKFLNKGQYVVTSKDILQNIQMGQRIANDMLVTFVEKGILKYVWRENHVNVYSFDTEDSLKVEDERLETIEVSSIDYLSLCNIIREETESKGNVVKAVSKVLLGFLESKKFHFSVNDIQEQCDLSGYEITQAMRKYRKKGFISVRRVGLKSHYVFCLTSNDTLHYENGSSETSIKYSEEIILLLDKLEFSKFSSKKDIRIATTIKKCMSKGYVELQDYEDIGENKKFRADMSFALQLGLVERIDDNTYRINTNLSPELSNIESSTKNVLTLMYKVFGRNMFSTEMVAAELDYSESYLKATLHRLTWLNVLDCVREEGKKIAYQFLVTPEDHPECFGTAA